MQKILLWGLGLTLCNAAIAQECAISIIKATRHEITSKWDKHPDQMALEIIAPFTPAVDSTMTPVLGRCDGGMDVGRPECALSNWVSDALRKAAETVFGIKADIGLCNMGGLRSFMPNGNVTQGNIFEIAPFENHLCLLTMRGHDLLELCRNIAKTGGEGISGLRIMATRNGNLLNATVDDKDINPDQDYTLATLNYLAEGNDNMIALRKATKRIDTTIPIRDILINAIRQETAAGRAIRAQIEGRMTIIDQPLRTGGHKAPAQLSPNPTLRILHTNDTHSQIMPFNPNSIHRDMADKGGYIRRSTFLLEERKKTPNLMLFDAGDFSQGSLYYNLYKGEVEVTLMNHMRYDACTIGNHEFDFGLENMARLFRMAHFAIICCNYDFTGTACEGLVKPYTIMERDGIRIGVLGVGCPLEGMVAKANCEGVVYHDPRDVVPGVVKQLRERERCNVVICLSHIGWGDSATNDPSFISATSGIDIVIGGHSHTYFEKPAWVKNANGQPVLYYQMGKAGRFIGDISFKIQR